MKKMDWRCSALGNVAAANRTSLNACGDTTKTRWLAGKPNAAQALSRRRPSEPLDFAAL